MNQDTLVLLSGMAPKEPEQWVFDEWSAKFEADYPKPWEPVGFDECLEASIETILANFGDIGFSVDWYTPEMHRSEARRLALTSCQYRWTKNQPLLAWQSWRRECLSEFTSHEWPLLWAKKRMQAAANKQHKADER